jgi:hypothetical protein
MSGMNTGNTSLLRRAEVWSGELKDVLEEDLMAAGYVKLITEFPDGDEFKIPSIGDARTDDYVEDEAVKYRPMDTGQFQFEITEYVSSGTYITKKAEQDMYYMNQLVSSFVPKQRRAIMERYEADVFAKPEAAYTANQQGEINGAYHRMSGGNSGRLELQDFAYAMYSLKKANVPQENMIAIVDPSVEYYINTLTNIVNVSNNAHWEGVIETGFGTGMRFVKNIYGFDVYTSNFLPDVTDNALPERDGSTNNDFSTTAGKPSYFFSAAGDVMPIVGAWRQMPEVDSEWNKDYQRTEFLTTARWGTKLYRPENMVSIVTKTDVS